MQECPVFFQRPAKEGCVPWSVVNLDVLSDSGLSSGIRVHAIQESQYV